MLLRPISWGQPERKGKEQHYEILRDRTLIPDMAAFLVSEERNDSFAADLMIG